MQTQPVDYRATPLQSSPVQTFSQAYLAGAPNLGAPKGSATIGAAGPAGARPTHRAQATNEAERVAHEGVSVSIKSVTALRALDAVNSVEETEKAANKNVAAYIKDQQPVEPAKATDEQEDDLDWTTKAESEKSLKERLDEQNKEPLSKQLIEFIQSMWRASALAVEVAQEAHATEQHERKSLFIRADDPRLATYEQPSRVKHTSGRSETWTRPSLRIQV